MTYLLIILGVFGSLISKTTFEQAEDLSIEAQKLFSEAKYGEGIILLEKAYELDSTNIKYQCEIANGYINVREYANAEKILKKLQYHYSVNDRVFQLLGNLYKAQNDAIKAEEYLSKGLRFFQNSGRLYLELGALKYYQEKIDEAVSCWLTGTRVEPLFASNYYWLSKHFSETNERLWAVLYGELFLLLEQSTFRSTEMGYSLFSLYRDAFEFTTTNTEGVSFLPYEAVEGEIIIPFSKRYMLTMKMARVVTDLGNTEQSIFYGISDIRFDFIEYWHDQRLNEIYPFQHFNFLKELYSLGFWDSYHVWLLLRWNEKEFKYWYKTNRETYDDFLVWLNSQDLIMDSKSIIFSELK